VLAHELCHVRRRDNLTAAIHMVVEAVFWFHPLVWWIGARLVEERERACDEEVLSLGQEPRDYADAILSVCKLYVESPLVCVSGVSGANLRRRIEAIMTNRRGEALTRAKKLLLASAGIAALVGPVAVGVVIGIGHVPLARAQAPAAPQKFDVASIRPCAPGAGRGRGGRGGAGSVTPGRYSRNCATVAQFIREAYLADGRQILESSLQVAGGPGWVQSDQYTIEATAEGTPNQSTMKGPMLRRFSQTASS